MRYCVNGDFDFADFPDYKGQNEADFIKEQTEKYSQEYGIAKERISKKSVRILESHDFFHDWLIESVTYTNSFNKMKDRVTLTLADVEWCNRITDRYNLEFYKVSDFRCEVKNSLPVQMPLGMESVLHIEILPIKDDRVSVELVSAEGSVLYFTCEGIIISRK